VLFRSGNAFSYNGVINTIDSTPLLKFGDWNGTNNLDVTSNLVFTSDRPLKFGSTGSIHIYDNNASGAGFHNDINDNDQTIDVTTEIGKGLISFSSDHKTVIINPNWDLDLSSNYSIRIDPGVFVTEQGSNPTAALEATFSTVTPGTKTTSSVSADAASSKIMTDLGTLVDSKKWFDFGEVGAQENLNLVPLGDLKGASYALVIKNYSTTPAGSVMNPGENYDGIASPPFNVKFDNFGQDDVLYIDSQAKNRNRQSYEPKLTTVLPNTTEPGSILQFSKAGDDQFADGNALANIGLTFEGLTDTSKYANYVAINTWKDPVYNNTNIGFADEWHNKSQAVIMG